MTFELALEMHLQTSFLATDHHNSGSERIILAGLSDNNDIIEDQ